MQIARTPMLAPVLAGLVMLATVTSAVALPPQSSKEAGAPLPTERFSAVVSSFDINATPIERYDPVYSEVARMSGVAGTVTVRIQVDVSGKVLDSTAISGHELLRESAANAARQWTFAPLTRDGKAVRVRGTIDFTFSREVVASIEPEPVILDGSHPGDVVNDAETVPSGIEEPPSGDEEIELVHSLLDDAIERARANPTSPELQVELARAYIYSGKPDESIAAYRTALQIKPDCEPAVLGLGETFAILGRIEEEIVSYRQALLVIPNSIAVLRKLSSGLSDQKRFSDSIPVFERLASLLPQDAYVANSLGWSLFRTDQLERADREFRRAIALKPDFGQALHNLGAIAGRRGRHDDAIDAYSRILTVDPHYGQMNRVHRELASIYVATRRYDDAIDLLETVISESPEFVDAYCQLCDALMTLERLDDARRVLKRAFVVNPDCRCALAYWVALQVRLRNPAEAEGTAGRLVALFPDDLYAKASFVRFLVDQRRFDEATVEAKAVVAKEPAQYRWHLLLGFVLNEAGKLREAEASFRSALALAPDIAEALNGLGYFLANHDRKLDEAISLLQRAVELEPKNGSIIDSLGWALVKVGKLDEAERFLDDAVSLRPESGDIQEHVGDLALTRGKLKKATKHWEQALTISSTTDAERARIREKLAKLRETDSSRER